MNAPIESPGLAVSNLSVRYGGLFAVSNLDLKAPAQRLTGLIGPNGSGKTSTFNALSGLVPTVEGRVQLFGEEISQLSPAARAQRGLGRTFQRMELFDSLTVADNVALGLELRRAGSSPLRHLFAPRADHNDIRRACAETIELCGLEQLGGERAGALSTGQRRLVELARAIAGGFRILLLDEPSSGLDVQETRRFGQVLREVVARGTGILLVEHDMPLVMQVCDYLYVIDFGQLIFEGTPQEVAASELVRTAYLGSEIGAA